jgi:hypothetical protein
MSSSNSKTKHTPGPWTASLDKQPLAMNGIGNYEVNGPKGIVCRTEESCIVETEANARLIAAAPEMLEALEWIFDHVNRLSAQPASENEYGLGKVKVTHGVGTVVDAQLIMLKINAAAAKATGGKS